MLPTNLTLLDFEDIKSSIKSYLQTRDEFTDYEFEGSGLSYLIDVLAYNTYYSSFMANMSMNEAFLDSASVRDNIVNIVKAFNYVPKSVTAATACFNLELQTTQTAGAYPNNVTLTSGPVAQGGTYTWNRLDPVTVTTDPSTGIAKFGPLKMREGSIITFRYTVNNFVKQNFVIPSSDADINTLKVSVFANATSTTSDTYNRVTNITEVTATDRVYFISETEDMRYELTFGDGVIGRKLVDGEVIEFEYLVTNGKAANEISSFQFIGKFTDSNGQSYASNDAIFTLTHGAQDGDDPETVESIKYNAPKAYAAQYRAVTAQDYEVILKTIYDNAKNVVAYGGDELDPPIYGKVFIAIRTKTGTDLNDATKKSLSQRLRRYAMASIEPVIEDAKVMYIYPKLFITYDTETSSRDIDKIAANAQDAINNYTRNSTINNFNGTFSKTKFENAITLSDKNIADVSTQISTLLYLPIVKGETNTYCGSTGNQLYDSNPSGGGDDGSGDGDGSGNGGNTGGDGSGCKKAPVVRSGHFYTAENPGVLQYFEDDGEGKLQIYSDTGNRQVVINDNAGTVDYGSGKVCFGPVTIVDPPGGGGDDDYQVPVQIIPDNTTTVPSPDPRTIIEIIVPTITVAPIGTTPPSSIPLNSLTPDIFTETPSVIELPDIDAPGDLSGLTCF